MFCRQHNMVWWMVYQIGELVLHGKQQLLLSSVLYLVNQGFKPNVAKFSNFSKETRNLNFLHEYEFTHFHQFSTSYDVMVAFSRDSDLLYLTHWFLFLLLSSLEMNFLDIPYGCAFSLSSEPANHFAHSLLLFLPMMSCTTVIYIYSVPPTRQ